MIHTLIILTTHLAFVDMVVRVDRCLGAQLSSHHLYGTVGNNFIGVHVRLCSRALQVKKVNMTQVTFTVYVGHVPEF